MSEFYTFIVWDAATPEPVRLKAMGPESAARAYAKSNMEVGPAFLLGAKPVQMTIVVVTERGDASVFDVACVVESRKSEGT